MWTTTSIAFDILNATIQSLNEALNNGNLTSEILVKAYLARIELYNKAGPCINALITINPDCLAQARERDAQRYTISFQDNPLYGIPFVVKDNYDTAGLATTGGSAVLNDSVRQVNAFVVQKLLDRGAILLGKANMSELALSYGRSGYSSAGGLTLNPYNLKRNVSGSSGGSAAAVAARFAPFALGTDTCGSILSPASVTGLVGIRPTLGLTSRTGVIPLSLSFDTTGVFAINVRDTALVLDALVGKDTSDAATQDQPEHTVSYAANLDGKALQGARLGMVSNFRGGNPDVDRIQDESVECLKTNGTQVIQVQLPQIYERLWEEVLEPVLEAEFKDQFERYLTTLDPKQPHTLAEFIQLSESQPINPERLAMLKTNLRTPLSNSPKYIRIVSTVIPQLRADLEYIIKSQQLSGLMMPTICCPASSRFDQQPDPTYVCHIDDPDIPKYIAGAIGFPQITVPAGIAVGDLPVGMSFLGLPYSEKCLIQLAYAFEQAHNLQQHLPRTTP
jgi:amidase